MSSNTITWNNLNIKVKIIIVLSLIQAPILDGLTRMQISNKISSDSKNTIALAVNDPPYIKSKTVISDNNKDSPDLSCIIKDVKGKESFTCGSYKFEILTYNENLSDDFLGGYIPENKSLESIGCHVKHGNIICREERIIERGPAAGLFVYRSFTAIYKPNPVLKKQDQTLSEFEACIYKNADGDRDYPNDIMKCNIGNEVEMKKCLVNASSFNGIEVKLSHAADCWKKTH